MDEIKKVTSKDLVYSIVKGSVSSVPIVGNIASELLGLIISSPLENRREKWMTDVGQRLKELEDSNKIDLTKLTHDEQFIDTVLQATSYALKTSEESKVEALRNAIVNTAAGEAPEKTIANIFLNLIDNFTGLHIQILHLFDDPEEWFRLNNRRFPSYNAQLSIVANEAYPDLRDQKELLNIVWEDLGRAKLRVDVSLEYNMTTNGLLSRHTTDFGRQFLQFIQKH